MDASPKSVLVGAHVYYGSVACAVPKLQENTVGLLVDSTHHLKGGMHLSILWTLCAEFAVLFTRISQINMVHSIVTTRTWSEWSNRRKHSPHGSGLIFRRPGFRRPSICISFSLVNRLHLASLPPPIPNPGLGCDLGWASPFCCLHCVCVLNPKCLFERSVDVVLGMRLVWK